jgi:tRNA (guanine37-N1)-methyltransferase
MKFTVLSLFPEILQGFLTSSIFLKSMEKGLVSYDLVQIRDFAHDKHNTCDDAPYGGGAGMVLKPEPLARALDSVQATQKRVVYMSPSGKPLTKVLTLELSQVSELVIICGRYEGIDQRVIDTYVTDEISIGDYVISSGEVAALVVIDAIYRRLDGVIRKESLEEESHETGLLEYPHYTRPEVCLDKPVPDVLLSGNHEAIRRWRRAKQLEKTKKVRPDLFSQYPITKDESLWLQNLEEHGGKYGFN